MIFPGFTFSTASEKWIEDGHPLSNHVTFYADNQESQPKSRQIVLALNLSVGCHKRVERTFCVGKKLFVPARLPRGFYHGPDRMVRKRCAYPRMDALVLQDAQASR